MYYEVVAFFHDSKMQEKILNLKKYINNEKSVTAYCLPTHLNILLRNPSLTFCSVQVLAKKMTVLYKLAREQLSKQSHYDFGLRALKSVLVMAGELKRGSPNLNEVETKQSSCLFCCIVNFLPTDIKKK